MLSGRADTVVVSDEWLIGPTMHCSHIVAACPPVLQVLNTLLVRMFYMLMMTLMSVRLRNIQAGMLDFFYVCDPRPTHVIARSPLSRETGFGAVRHMALQISSHMSGATVHITTSEPTLIERWVPEPLDQ
jgi:hypothetical protein